MPAVAVMPDVTLNSPFRVIAFHSAQYAHAIAPYAGCERRSTKRPGHRFTACTFRLIGKRQDCREGDQPLLIGRTDAGKKT
jgi:hypothetical protein